MFVLQDRKAHTLVLNALPIVSDSTNAGHKQSGCYEYNYNDGCALEYKGRLGGSLMRASKIFISLRSRERSVGLCITNLISNTYNLFLSS